MIADDGYALHDALAPVLEAEPGIELAATCADSDELMAAVETLRPAVVVTGVRPAGTSPDADMAMASRLRDTHPEIGLILVSDRADPRCGLSLVERGAAGRAYLLRTHVRDRGYVVAGLRAVARSGSLIDPDVVQALIAASLNARGRPLAQLTRRELDLLARVAQGEGNPAIARSLDLDVRAVGQHVRSVFTRLGLPAADGQRRRVDVALAYLSELAQTSAGI